MATTVAFTELDTWLQSQPANTASTPYELEITGLTANNIKGSDKSGSLGYVLKNNATKYVDLSNTVIPSVTSMYWCFEKCYSLVKAPNIPDGVTDLRYCFQDCSLEVAPEIPNSVTNMEGCFRHCHLLLVAPEIPSSVTNITLCFSACYSLTIAPSIPDTITNIANCFSSCTSLTTVLSIPKNIVNIASCFYGCTSLTTVKFSTINFTNIAHGLAFKDCTNLTEFYCDAPYELKNWLNALKTETTNNFPNDTSNCHFYLYSDNTVSYDNQITMGNEINTLVANTVSTPFKIKLTELTAQDVGASSQGGSSGTLGSFLIANPTKYVDLSETEMPNVADLTSTFENCTTLTASPDLPSSVTILDSTYKGCSNLTKIKSVPSTVTDLTDCFKNCSSLESIDEFDVPLSVLKTNAEDCFSGCTSLASIGVQGAEPITEASQWHAIRLNFGADNVSGKVYDKDKNTTTIPQTTIVKGTLSLPIKTDELWFPPANAKDSDIDAIIESVIDTKRTYFNKPVLNPNNKSFVLWKGDNSNFVSNIDFGGGGGSGIEVYPTEEDIIEDLPNLNDDDIVASYGDGEGFNDAPLGTIAAYYGTTDPSGGKWLICDGRDTTGTVIELETHYPSLYMFLGGTNVLPDLRETTLVGVGENATDNIETHDVYTLGEFKDDQFQTHTHTVSALRKTTTGSTTTSGSGSDTLYQYAITSSAPTNRKGDTTHGKQKGVSYIIKATDSVDVSPIPSSDIITIESYFDQAFDNFMTAYNNWEDVTSDFSVTDQVNWANTPTSSLKVLYNAVQKKLKVWSCRNSTSASHTDHYFTLKYNGSNANITFSGTTTALQMLVKGFVVYSTGTGGMGGFEPSYNVRSATQIRLGAYNRNESTAWTSDMSIFAEISL